MSDFDKEAERERLREKYEQEQQSREVAEKMSELLLQGATMTNAHCSQCGDPIFRYDGQEFCATCEQPVDRSEEPSDSDDDQDPPEGDEDIEVTTPTDDAHVQFGPDEADDRNATASGTTEASGAEPPATDRTASQSEPSSVEPEPAPGQDPAREQQRRSTRNEPLEVPETTARTDDGRPAETGDVSAARESLVRTLNRFSRQAEATEDPQRASEYLAAAREAAETLSALRR